MASVRDIDAPLPQESSNTVIFEMMMHYKRRMEVAETTTAHLKKRAKIMEEVWEEEIQARDERLDVEIIRNRQLMAANQRGAAMCVRKHAAGMRLINCLDELFTSIDVATSPEMNIGGEYAIEYVTMHRDSVSARATMAFEMLIQEHAEDELDSDEVIDLTGETTEEEDETEL